MQIRNSTSAGRTPQGRERTRNRRARRCWPVAGGLVAALAAATLAGCGPVADGAQGCSAAAETLPASVSSSVITLVPRTSRADAIWALDELAQLMPFVARGGLQLHVLYTQDSDDLVEGGGDGGPPQVIFSSAPAFAGFGVTGAPQRPADPTSLTGKLYCQNLAAWQRHAGEAVQAQADARAASVAAWAKTIEGRLSALASRPIPDTSGGEAGTEIDSGASIFTAAQIAETAPQPAIVFLGGLTALAPPPQDFRLSARLVALIWSSDPAQVLQAEVSWRRWAGRADGSFDAVSANAAPAAIAQEVDGGHD